MKRIVILIALSMMLGACSHVVTKESRMSASTVPFGEVRKDIDKHKESIFIWGGTVVETTFTEEGSMIEIIQNPLDNYEEIVSRDLSEGRFIAFYKGKTADPLIYKRHRLVTVAGVLKGKVEKPLKGVDYVYPLIEIKEIYLWKEEPSIQHPPMFYNYGPYNYGPPWYYPTNPYYPYIPFP